MKPSGGVGRCPTDSGCTTVAANRFRGFSLIELLVVVAILIILTSMYWGSGGRKQQRAKQKTCQGNLQKIFIAMQIYATENRTRFPAVAGAQSSEAPLDLLVPKYNADTAIFICPGSKDSPLSPGEPLRNGRISYAYYMGRSTADAGEALLSDRQVDTLPKTAGQNVFSPTGKPPGNNHAEFGGNFLFGDGRTETTPPALPFSLTNTLGVVLLNPKP